MLKEIKSPLRNLSVWRSTSSLYIIGQDKNKLSYQVLVVNCPSDETSGALELIDDSRSYTIDEVNLMIEDLQLTECIQNIYAIFGFIQLLDTFHLLVVTKVTLIAEIHDHPIYAVDEMSMIPVIVKNRYTNEEQRYRNILQKNDFSNGYYFSYTYDITNCFEKNCVIPKEIILSCKTQSTATFSSNIYNCCDIFAWNYYAAQPFLSSQSSHLNPTMQQHRWIVPFIYGFIEQFTFSLQNSNRKVKYTLISRRSRHFAGTRNLRRGCNYEGYVANEVETEQIVTIVGNVLSPHRSSSVVMHRGSIPIFWSHTNLFAPNPDIQLEPMDSNLSPSNKHFQRLFRTYGSTIVVLSLVKQCDVNREILLGNAFKETCHFLNDIYRKNDPLLINDSPVNGGETDHSDPEKIPSNIVFTEYDMLNDQKSHEEGLNQFGMIYKLQQYAQLHCSLTGFFTQPRFKSSTKDSHTNHSSTSSNEKKYKYELFSTSKFCMNMYRKNFQYDDEENETNETMSDDESDEYRGSISESIAMSPDRNGTADQINSNLLLASKRFRSFLVGFYRNIGLTNEFPKYNDVTNKRIILEPQAQNNAEDIDKLGYESLDQAIQTTLLEELKNPSNQWNRPGLQRRPSLYTSHANNAINDQLQPFSRMASSNQLKDPFNSSFEEFPTVHVTYSSSVDSQASPDNRTIQREDDTDLGLGNGYSNGLLQNGIVRTNCLDCLDRTNIAQFCYAKTVLPLQLLSLGVDLSIDGMNKLISKVLVVWSQHGDVMAMQYGGSVAMHRLNEKDACNSYGEMEFTVAGGARNAMTAMQRYYSNISTDFERQQAMDLLLGVFIPSIDNNIHVWEIDQRPQHMRRPSGIESCLIPFPLNSYESPLPPSSNKEIETRIETPSMVCFDEIDHTTQVFDVPLVHDVNYQPHPTQYHSQYSFSKRKQSKSSMIVHDPNESIVYRQIVSDYEQVYQTKRYQVPIPETGTNFNCYGCEDINGDIIYQDYLQSGVMTTLSDAESNTIQNQFLSLEGKNHPQSEINQEIVQGSLSDKFILPLNEQYGTWVAQEKLGEMKSPMDGDSIVSFPEFISVFDTSEIGPISIPIITGDNEDDEGKPLVAGEDEYLLSSRTMTIDSTAADESTPTTQDALLKTLMMPLNNIDNITVESISQPFKWFFNA